MEWTKMFWLSANNLLIKIICSEMSTIFVYLFSLQSIKYNSNSFSVENKFDL